jgi:hypothetical protein
VPGVRAIPFLNRLRGLPLRQRLARNCDSQITDWGVKHRKVCGE